MLGQEHHEGCMGCLELWFRGSIHPAKITVFLETACHHHAVTVSRNTAVAELFTGQTPFLSPNQPRQCTEGLMEYLEAMQ